VSENLDLVRSIYADWERADWSNADWAHPEIDFVVPDGPVPFTSTGVAEMAKNWRDWLSAWEGYRIEAEEYRELDDGRVLVLSRYGARGKTSGLEGEKVGSRAAQVFEIHGRKVTKLIGYNERDRALADLGMEE
jgi:hypothetical protein